MAAKSASEKAPNDATLKATAEAKTKLAADATEKMKASTAREKTTSDAAAKAHAVASAKKTAADNAAKSNPDTTDANSAAEAAALDFCATTAHALHETGLTALDARLALWAALKAAPLAGDIVTLQKLRGSCQDNLLQDLVLEDSIYPYLDPSVTGSNNSPKMLFTAKELPSPS